MLFRSAKGIAINFAPATGKVVMVKDPDLRSKYGNDEDQFARWELGAQLKIDAEASIENLKASTTLTLFSDYLNKPLNVKINWDVNIEAKITKFLSATLRTYLIYDDTIRFIEKKDSAGNVVTDENGETILVQGVQLKELFSLSLSYTFGGAAK